MASKYPDSPTKLTEFAPLSSDSKPSGGFFSRLFGRKGDDSDGKNEESKGEHGASPNPLYQKEKNDFEGSRNSPQQVLESSIKETGSESDDAFTSSTEGVGGLDSQSQTRTLSSVLNRVSNILDRRSQTPQAYKDSDFKQYWMPDNNCKECYDCGDRFNTFRRRHHCRICGQIFCSRCCNQEIPGKIMGYTGYLRVCTYCCKVVLSYAQNPEASGDLRALSDDLRHMSTEDSDPSAGAYQDIGPWTPTARRRVSRTSRVSSVFEEDMLTHRLAGNAELHPSPREEMNPFSVTSVSEYGNIQSFKHERRMLTRDSAQLRDIWIQMQHPVDGIEMQSHRHRLRTYPNCLVGEEIAKWLITRDKAANIAQAIAIGQALVDAKWLQCVTSNEQVFRDEYVLYRPGEAATKEGETEPAIAADLSIVEDDDDADTPQWFREIKRDDADTDSLGEFEKIPATVSGAEKEAESKSVFYIDEKEDLFDSPERKSRKNKHPGIERGERGHRMSSGSDMADIFNEVATGGVDNPPQFQDSTNAGIADELLKGAFAAAKEEVKLDIEIPEGWESSDLREENGERLAFERLCKAHQEHMTALIKQLLNAEGLSLKWSDLIIPVVKKICNHVKPDVKNEKDDMDIGQYVQIKKIPGGSRSQSNIVFGVVCSKNVAHKKMKQLLQNPQILLLRAPIEYQRVENKFSSLEPQILQEHEFLKNCVSKIASLQPDILLVEKTVSRLAQDFIKQTGITLVLNVKPSVMQRVSRFTEADIVSSIDTLVGKPKLGTCATFKMQSYILTSGKCKTLMYFDGCNQQLGCTLTLRGGSLSELKKVKQILHFALLARYHSKLEKSFLMDEFAMPPPAPDENALDISGLLSQNIVSPEEEEEPENLKQIKPIEEIDFNCDKDLHMFIKSGSVSVTVDKEVDGFTLLPSRDKLGSTSSSNSKVGESENSASKVGDDIEVPPSLKEKKKTREAAETTQIVDYSDPLQNYQKSQDDSIFTSKVSLKEEVRKSSHRFKKALEDVILSSSPYLKHQVPYLETEAARNCKLRIFFPKDIYWSEKLADFENRRPKKYDYAKDDKEQSQGYLSVTISEPHDFIQQKLTAPITDNQTQALLADFRARGGRIQRLSEEEIRKNASKDENQNDYNSQQDQWEKNVDCLNPYNHQRIAVLFSSFSNDSTNAPNPCVNPWIINMDYYGRNDITLGGFLERFCFRETYTCSSESCDTPMVDHVRRFVHQEGCLQIMLKKLDAPIPSYQNNILMWGWCRKCKQVTPVVPMSMDTWSMSFAKYLELRFHGDVYARRASAEPCPHSLHHDHFQYFGCRQVVASFKYFPIQLKEIALPPISININNSVSTKHYLDEANDLHYSGTCVFNSVLEHLHRLEQDGIHTDVQANTLDEYNTKLQKEKEVFGEQLELIQGALQVQEMTEEPMLSATDGSNCALYIAIDTMVKVKRQLAEAINNWNLRVLELAHQLRRFEKERSKTNSSITRSGKEGVATPEHIASSTASGDSKLTIKEVDDSGYVNIETDQAPKPGTSPSMIQSADAIMFSEESSTPSQCADNEKPKAPQVVQIMPSKSETDSTPISTGSPSGGVLEAAKLGIVIPERPTHDEIDSGSGKYSSSPQRHQRSKSLGETKKHLVAKQMSSNPQDFGMPEFERSEKRSSTATVKQIFTNLLSSAETNPIDMPFKDSEHHLLPPCEAVPIVVYDTEPSSIIAYTLSSPEYIRQLQELKTQCYQKTSQSSGSSQNPSPSVRRKDGVQFPEAMEDPGVKRSVLSFFQQKREKSPNRNLSKYDVDTVKYTPRLDRDSIEEMDDPDAGFTIFASADGEKNPATSSPYTNWHIELQFSDNNAKFLCRVYYAQQFKNLRKLIFPSGEARFIRSLSRCFTWMARGGKSGSAFCKTQDDRFILKQMSKLEVQSFVDFAPHYFQYVTMAYQEEKPTVLAKILGVYRIGFKNNQNNTTLKQDLLVMENLFYNRKVTQIFDLKGSVRNRLVNTSGKRVEDMVLLDENLLKLSVDSPLYIRPHSKTVLTIGITNDTQFLSSHLVMDYSLLVGIDETGELVVGIIDYIRTFTWDKKLEMVFKATYSQLGGQGKMPTVVSPEIYRTRFREAMDKYFLLVPDRWFRPW